MKGFEHVCVPDVPTVAPVWILTPVFGGNAVTFPVNPPDGNLLDLRTNLDMGHCHLTLANMVTRQYWMIVKLTQGRWRVTDMETGNMAVWNRWDIDASTFPPRPPQPFHAVRS